MKDLKKAVKKDPITPKHLEFDEAIELFGTIEPEGARVLVCTPLAYEITPGTNMQLGKDMLERQNILLAHSGALMLKCNNKPELVGKKVIVSDYQGQHQKRVTILKDVTLDDGTIVKDHPTDYLAVVIFYSDIVCTI